MTLPSEGINPWRVAPAPGGTNALPAKHTPARLPDLKLGNSDALDAPGKPADTGKEFKAFGDDGLTFWDMIDVVNPLQHIPVVSTLYRDMTNDTLDPAPRVMGGTLFMGPIGLVASVANVMVEHNTGKDMGGHVMAYFRDDAQPLSTTTAAAAPAAAGTDGTDPVSQWAAEQTAFYRAGDDAGDPVSRWAAEQQAFYQGRDGQGRGTTATAAADPVGQWAAEQTAFYQDGAPARATQLADAALPPSPVAAGTDGVDVTAWAARQTAYYRAEQPATAAPTGGDVTAWAEQQVAYYRDGRAPVAAGTDGTDVTAWAQRQTAYYRAGAETGPARQQPPVQTAQTGQTGSAGIDGDVSTWARDQLAWVMGDRAKEVAAMPDAQPRERTAARRDDDGRKGPETAGAVAKGGGWFRDNMVDGWTRYQAAQRLAEPGYRPDLTVATGER
ncbi:MAG: hypothetical protein CMM77_00835 [Rhodospirillaceae bacterium]|nr:hypothetical protein [Magnetovibrio sp.]MAY65653.1 hypothetical protein [Rhodospirillaceae bacterium]